MFESFYERQLVYDLRQRGLHIANQVEIPVFFEDGNSEIGFRADLIVEHAVIVEIKSVQGLLPVHKKQVITYLRLTGLKIGLLINFNEELLKNGITRLFNNFAV